MNTIFSAIQPSGIPTIGNYIGAMKHFVQLQENIDGNFYFCIADLHAITSTQNPKELRNQILDLAALYLAIGLDPNKITLFIQSEVPAHSQMAWIIQTLTPLGELERMTQFKDKSKKNETILTGLLTYPTLMVGDIILYDTTLVPVGADQKQHLELTRNFVDRFNNRYAQKNQQLLIKPEVLIPKSGARIMSLQNPENKMSKSDSNKKSFISMFDDETTITKTIMSAVTDSHQTIEFDPENRPAVANLLTIFSEVTNTPVEKIVDKYRNSGYGPFKKDLAKAIIEWITPIQIRYNQIRNSEELLTILNDGALKANNKANKVLKRINNAIGIGRK